MRTWLLVLAACSAPVIREPIEWSPPIEIAHGGGQKGPWKQNDSVFNYIDDPTVALDAHGGGYIAWVDNDAKEVLVQRFEPSGWRRRAVNVSRTPTVFSWLPRLVISPRDPKRVFVLWQEMVFSGGSHGGEIYFARSVDGGRTFETPINVSQSPNGDGNARIEPDHLLNGSLDLIADTGGTLYAAWSDYEGTLWFSRSADDGSHFTPPLPIVINRTRPACAPALATGGGVIYLAWTIGEDPRADIHLATSSDGGETFTPAIVVSRTAGYSGAPKIAVDVRGTLHLVHSESRDGPFGRSHIRYMRSVDHGRTFEAPREISAPPPHDATSAAFPSLALDGERVIVTWELYPALEHPRGLALAFSADGGVTFARPTMIPGSRDSGGGDNGSLQGRLMRKLAVGDNGLAVVNSAMLGDVRSRVWLIRGRWR
ncbi:MAG TPA: sialidase family protein [Kofleriaceae bacterium]|nr:sialidase family protein [Kofleriaceae bacterium]